jgi:2-polyprenyl-3-methyl-5-hydroxy-6-metoxy-1,4-benzoquinol methylase
MVNRERWNELYQRAGQAGLPPAEMDSVLQARRWGAAAAAQRTDYQWWLQHVQHGSRMLDVGCGNGSYLASMISHHGGVGVGIDVSDVAIDFARGRAAYLTATCRSMASPTPICRMSRTSSG